MVYTRRSRRANDLLPLQSSPKIVIIIFIAPFAIDSYTRVRLAEKKNRRVYSLLVRIVLLLLRFWRRGGRHPFLCLLKATALKRRTLNAFDLKEVSCVQPPEKIFAKSLAMRNLSTFVTVVCLMQKRNQKRKKKTNPLPPSPKKRKKNMQQKQGGKTNTTATTTTTTSSSKFNTNNANTMVVRPRANNARLFKKAR